MSERTIIAVIVIVRTALAIGFSLGPIFEGPDEIEHFRYIRTLNATQALPDTYDQQRGEYHQAPLYYLLAWPVLHVLLLGTGFEDDFAQFDEHLNPFYGSMIDTPSNDNKNVYLHSRNEDFPYSKSQTAQAVHLIRLMSVCLGALAVIVSYFIARLVWPQAPDKRLLAVGFVAFWPQFVFISSLINNDNLLIFLATLTLWVILIQLRDGVSWRNAAYLGIILGALLLTKVSAVFIGLPVAVVYARAFWLDRRAWRYTLVTVGIMVAISGWWYIHNWVTYGDPLGTQAVFDTWPEEVIRPGTLALDIGIERLPYAYSSLWARFGHGAVPVSDTLYTFFDGLIIVALLGAGLKGIRQAIRSHAPWRMALPQVIAIGVFGGVWIFALLYWASIAWSGNQGRYLLPGIAAYSIVLAFGLLAWIPPQVPARRQIIVSLAWVGVFASVSGVSYFVYFRPAYEVSSPPQAIEHPLSYTFGDYAELIGVSPSHVKGTPGDTISISLYWRAVQPAPGELLTYVHSVETDVVRRDSYPATGNLLATEWRSGEEWAEHFHIQIPTDAATQQSYTLIAGLYDPHEQRALDALAGDDPVTPVIARLSIHAPADPIQTQDAYCFGDLFVLRKPETHEDDESIAIDFVWQALRETPIDYALFVHVLDDNGDIITQADSQLRQGIYPTSAWASGEVVSDHIAISLPDMQPEQPWQLAIGLYDPQDFTRLPIRRCNGESIGDALHLR